MKLRAQITIELDAADYREAANHQQGLEAALTLVREAYPQAVLSLKTRRRPSGPRSKKGLLPVAHGAIRQVA